MESTCRMEKDRDCERVQSVEKEVEEKEEKEKEEEEEEEEEVKLCSSSTSKHVLRCTPRVPTIARLITATSVALR
uniref:Uncharacterized protein n=1 Tax=Vespula pensylvanica TaxID=30213 RepID=A0A834KMC8_VESPE|nr:hypothetical protein H0235_014322 [Vespula pensylvanica]